MSASSLFFTTCCLTALTGFNELASSTEKKNIAPAMQTTHAMITATFVIHRSFRGAQLLTITVRHVALFLIPRPACTLQACVPLLNLPEPTFGNFQGNEIAEEDIKTFYLHFKNWWLSRPVPKIVPPLRPTHRQPGFSFSIDSVSRIQRLIQSL
jgi:hypothetical protein